MLTTPCLPVTTNQPSSVSIHETYNEISTNSNKSTSKLKDEDTLDSKENVLVQPKKEPKSDKSTSSLTPSKKKTKTKKSMENEPKPVLKVEAKKPGSSSRGGLPDFSRKLSDIKARLKPVEDPKPKEVSTKIVKSEKATREATNKQTNISENISTKPVPIVNNTSGIEIVNTQSHGHAQGPLCPMHAQAHAHAQRKASEEESHQQNDITNKNDTEKDNSEPIAAPRGRKLTDSSSRKSSSQSVDRKHRQHSASTSSDVRRRTPSCSSDDNLLSDRSEKSFGG